MLPATVLQAHLDSIGACPQARKWAGDRTPQQAWDECERADWLLWWLGRTEVDRQKLVQITCLCVRTALPYTKDPKVLACIEATELWASDPTEDNIIAVKQARKAAVDAAYDAYDAYAAYDADTAYAAYATAHAAHAAHAAALAADAAADAAATADAAAATAYAAYAADAAYATAYAAAGRLAHLYMCSIIRESLKCPLVC